MSFLSFFVHENNISCSIIAANQFAFASKGFHCILRAFPQAKEPLVLCCRCYQLLARLMSASLSERTVSSRRQCCAAGCSNRRGRCPICPVTQERICGCSVFSSADCPRSRSLLTLHKISSMPTRVRRVVLQRINRKDGRGRNWQPSSEAVVCNMHYENREGPNASRRQIVPVKFAHRSSYGGGSEVDSHSRPQNRPTLSSNCDNDDVMKESTQCDPQLQDGPDIAEKQRDVDVPLSVRLKSIGRERDDMKRECSILRSKLESIGRERDDLKRECSILQSKLESTSDSVGELTFSSDRLSDGQLKFYTGFSGKELFNIVWQWLKPAADKIVLSGANIDGGEIDGPRSEHDYASVLTEGGRRTRQLPLKDEFFLVLVRIRLGAIEEDLAYRFRISQQSVSAIWNAWLPFLAAQLRPLITWPLTASITMTSGGISPTQ